MPFDFFDDQYTGSPEDEAKRRAEQASAPPAPALTYRAKDGQMFATAAQRDAHNRNLDHQAGYNPYDPNMSGVQSSNLAAQGRQNLINSGVKQATVSPGQWGLKSYTAQGRPDLYSMDIPSNPFKDAAEIGGYFGTLGPVRDTIAEYTGPVGPLALLGPIGAAGMVTDAVSSGRGGAPTLPESMQNPAYTGAAGGNSGAGAGTGSGSGGAGSDGLSTLPTPTRPDSYRSDAITNDIRALLDAERRSGPSEAEALMLKATDRAAANALGIAAGARGGAGARERATRQAIFSNAANASTASADVAALRAREDAERRQRQQAIMGLLQGNAIAGDTRDLGYYESDNTRGAARDNIMAQIREDARQFDLTRSDNNMSEFEKFKNDPVGWLFERGVGIAS